MPADRFWSKVDIGGPDACWLWIGARNHYGYGLAWDGRQKRWLRAHRVAWEMANRPIPEGLSICHSCDNPPCVNPGHLFLGTTADNVRDMLKKGRGAGPPRRHGPTERFADMTPEERFWSYVDRTEPEACWEWPSADPFIGYARYWDPASDSLHLVHRYAWTLVHGELPSGHRVMHVCRNRTCVNPTHLFGGTYAEFLRAHPECKPNYNHRSGAANAAAKLTAEAVRTIRKRYETGESSRKLGAAYGVTGRAILDVVHRRTWGHVA